MADKTVAVYTIAKNEEEFVARWAESAKDADYIVLVDTGSTDNTVKAAKDAGCIVKHVHIDPWRFDDARNAALALLPQVDWCIALDADEVLKPGWREELEALPDEVTRPRYRYVWSWNRDGSEGLVYGGEKIHRRNGYRWKHPVHEILSPSIDEVQEWCGLEIHHHPDDTKARSQYLPLLEVAAAESPDCDRTAHYLGREYIFNWMYEEAARELKRHLDLPSAVWHPERAASMRYLSKCPDEPSEYWLLRACAEAPDRRESWVALAQFYHDSRLWEQCLGTCERALMIEEKPLDYLCEPFAWDSTVYDLAANSAFYIGGLTEKAAFYGKKALDLDPDNARLIENMTFYEKAKHPIMIIDPRADKA